MTTRKTLKDFLSNRGLTTQSSISYALDSETTGPADSLNEGDELGKDPSSEVPLIDPSDGLLGDYLKFIVDQSSNIHKFKSGNSESASSKRGDYLQQAIDHGIENIFVEPGSTKDSLQKEYSNSGYLDSENLR